MSKCHFLAVACILTVAAWACGAEAKTYNCPAANMINCVPTPKTVGPWNDTGIVTTGNTFAPNNICPNVNDLTNGMKRLFCCYAHCGFFWQDVEAKKCTKESESQFSCD